MNGAQRLLCFSFAALVSQSFGESRVMYDKDLIISDLQRPVIDEPPMRIAGSLIVNTTENISSWEGLTVLEMVDGDVVINGTEFLQDLDWLQNLRVVGGSLTIGSNGALTSSWLQSLERVGGDLVITGNRALLDLGRFDRLAHIGGLFRVSGNSALLGMHGFGSVERVGGYLQISDNNLLHDVGNWSSLRTIGDRFAIIRNPALVRVTGFAQLDVIKNHFWVNYNALLDTMTDFPSLRRVGGEIYIGPQLRLRQLNGFQRLELVGHRLMIQENNWLEEVGGFGRLETASHNLWIAYNGRLEEISGFHRLRAVKRNLGFQMNSAYQGTSTVRITGFPQLQTVGGDLRFNGGRLVQLSGLGRLASVGGSLEISETQLVDISGLNELVSVGSHLNFQENPRLLDVSGLLSLQGVKDSLEVKDHRALERISGLSSLQQIKGDCLIVDNQALEDLSGLRSLSMVGGNIRLLPNSSRLITDLDSLRQHCHPWEVPDENAFHCKEDGMQVHWFVYYVTSLAGAFMIFWSTWRQRLEIKDISSANGTFVFRTKKHRCLRRRKGATFPIVLDGTGCPCLDCPKAYLVARVNNNFHIEIEDGLIPEDCPLEGSSILSLPGHISVRPWGEFFIFGWKAPAIAWISMLLAVSICVGVFLRIGLREHLSIVAGSFVLAALLTLPRRIWVGFGRHAESKERLKEVREARLLRRLEASCWEADEEEQFAVRQESMKLGWDGAKFEDRRNKSLKAQSEHAGISVAFLLSQDFLSLAQQRSGKEDPDFYELKDAFYFSKDPVGQHVACPRDGRPGCAFIDTVPREHRRPATHFLSWTWSYKLSIIRSALQIWVEQSNIDPSCAFLYMCFFVNNQFRILVEGTGAGSDNLEEVFDCNLQRIGKMVALLDTWEDPVYLSRIWPVFEQFTAARLGIDVEIIVPEAARRSLISEIYRGVDGIRLVKKSLCHVDSKSAKAWSLKDEHRVKKLIEDAEGFKGVDWKVRHSMVSWVARQVQEFLIRLVREEEEQRTPLSAGRR